jgi:hypothetical protein
MINSNIKHAASRRHRLVPRVHVLQQLVVPTHRQWCACPEHRSWVGAPSCHRGEQDFGGKKCCGSEFDGKLCFDGSYRETGFDGSLCCGVSLPGTDFAGNCFWTGFDGSGCGGKVGAHQQSQVYVLGAMWGGLRVQGTTRL